MRHAQASVSAPDRGVFCRSFSSGIKPASPTPVHLVLPPLPHHLPASSTLASQNPKLPGVNGSASSCLSPHIHCLQICSPKPGPVPLLQNQQPPSSPYHPTRPSLSCCSPTSAPRPRPASPARAALTGKPGSVPAGHKAGSLQRGSKTRVWGLHGLLGRPFHWQWRQPLPQALGSLLQRGGHHGNKQPLAGGLAGR